MPGRSQRGSAWAVIILITALAMAGILIGGKVVNHGHGHPSNPIAPLIGAADQAKATADAASRAARQQELQTGTADPQNPTSETIVTSAP